MSQTSTTSSTTKEPRITHASPSGSRMRFLIKLVGPLCVMCVGCFMMDWTWAKHPDPIIDTGRELYIPWQLAQGKVLYRDIAYFNGPLSPYLNSLLFRMFGVHLSTLLWGNLLIAAAITGLLYYLILRFASHFTATVASGFFVAVFAFNCLGTMADFSFIFPYSHEMSHGLFFSLLAIVTLDAFMRSGRWPWLIVAGFHGGLVWLGKVEFSLALTVAMGGGFAVWAYSSGVKWWRGLGLGLLLVLATVIPILMAGLALGQAMPAEMVIKSMAGSWRHIGDPVIGAMPFYRELMGLDHPMGNAVYLLKVLAVYALIFGPIAAVSLASRKPWQRVASTVLFPLLVFVIPFIFDVNWDSCLTPMPLLLGVAVAVCVTSILRRSEPTIEFLPVVMSLFAWALLARICLNARPYRYGFALAAPSAMLLLTMLLHTIPQWIARRGGAGAAFRMSTLVFVGGSLYSYFFGMVPYFAGSRIEPVSTDTGEFWADYRGANVRHAIEYLEQNADPSQTLAVLPEGATINFLTQRINPTRYIVALPLEWHLFGEGNVQNAYEASPPDFIAIVHRDTTDFGATFFGRDYAVAFVKWIEANYQRVAIFGNVPNERPHGEGIAVWKRTSATAQNLGK